jgi:putative MATE family efflux protein
LAQRPLRAIVALAAPTTAVMLMAAVSNVLHTYFVSRLGDDAIAAVSLVFPISLTVMTVVSGGIGAGVASGIARALGAGRRADARGVAEHALAIAGLLSVFGTIATEIWGTALFRAMGGQGIVLDQATQFARVLFGGLLITLTVGTFDSILRGCGNVRIPALCATLSLALQVAFTPLFMFPLGLGLVGAPLATLSGQFIGMLPRLVYLTSGRGPFRLSLFPRRIDRAHTREILRVGVPAAFSAALNYLALIVLTGTVARYGNHYLAGYGLGTRLDFLLYTLGFGVAAAALVLVGMATGAGRPDLVLRYVLQSCVVAAALVAIPAVLVIVRPGIWLTLFTAAPDIGAVGAAYFHRVGPTYVLIVSSMVLASAFQGLGRATVPLTVMIARVALVVAVALAATRFFHASADDVFTIIAVGNAGACLSLICLFLAAFGFRRAAVAKPSTPPAL